VTRNVTGRSATVLLAVLVLAAGTAGCAVQEGFADVPDGSRVGGGDFGSSSGSGYVDPGAGTSGETDGDGVGTYGDVDGAYGDVGDGPLVYRPVAFGANGRCYYVHTAAEVTLLQEDQLCPADWVPAAVPGPWHDRYFFYYSSPRYVNSYVPRTSRATFQARERAYLAARTAAVVAAGRTAVYQGSNGTTTTGAALGVARAGSGLATRKSFGGGIRCSPVRGWMRQAPRAFDLKGGGGSTGGGRSGGGSGSARGGGSWRGGGAGPGTGGAGSSSGLGGTPRSWGGGAC
jgi:hypothetical protein